MASHSITQREVVFEQRATSLQGVAREILDLLFGPADHRGFSVRLWDGTLDAPPGTSRFTLILRHPAALRRMLLPWPTDRRLGEAYLRDDCDIDGDFEAAASLVDTLRLALRRSDALRLLVKLGQLRNGEATVVRTERREAYRCVCRRHSRTQDGAAIHYHYDVGNDFYQLWLDRRMVYSCAYFPNGNEDLDAAQEAKLDLICRKLRLRAGERLLDIGCGWGALILYAAERYGVDAIGITISREQAALASERIAASGLGNRCRVELRDYRDLPSTEFDKIASVGMVEHVGRAMLPAYFRHLFGLLKPGGLFLNHGIVTLEPTASMLRRVLARALHRRTSFIDAYVFPDGDLVAPADVLAPATAAGFEVRDVENLREHYARTLRHWVRRLEARHDEAARLVGEATYRAWRAYMAGSAHAFASGEIGVIQTLLAKRDAAGAVTLPATRADLYLPESVGPSQRHSR